jgi:BirA family biotin operon repressor/biotin-[acetyl-CoA-carboxylase] ligase
MTPRVIWNLGTRRLGRQVLVFDRLESTNNLAAALAGNPANEGVVVLADEQTAGRGQLNRRWICPAGSGVLLSVLLFPPTSLRRVPILTAWAAVSVCETIAELTGIAAHIKWPNDVLLQGRKVCGILIEQSRATVAGIGLNVNQPLEAFAQSGLTEAGSLFLFTGLRRDCHEVARCLIRRLDEEYDRLCSGDLATLHEAWRKRLDLLGKQVIVQCPDRAYQGDLQEIGWKTVQLQSPEGQLVSLKPEMIQNLSPVEEQGPFKVERPAATSPLRPGNQP